MASQAGIDLRTLVGELADRDRSRTEADVQSSIKTLLLAAPLNLGDDDVELPQVALEAQAGQGRRIDVEVGSTVIEVKKDLRVGNVRTEAVEQLAAYVAQRAATVAQRYVGVLTDGCEWHLYHLIEDELSLASSLELDTKSPDVDGLLLWLEGVLATADQVKPTPKEIAQRLGARSSAHQLDSADLAALYELHRDDPTVKLKRELWGRLLTTALGTAFEDSDELFVNHTLLVLSAECIAHAVIGWDLHDPALTPEAICTGDGFARAQIAGVVESDFFDWPIEVEGGDRFVRTLARRLARFDWGSVEHDVMKVLYESVISAEQRHRLGEYYTPDWLAQRIVETVVPDPVGVRALDPSCGSGTFLFHAVRLYLAAAAEKGVPRTQALADVCAHIFGIDVHPVAVAFARVTYLLALGDLSERPPLSIPVYLGDSVQWNQEENLLTADALTIDTSSSPATLFAEPLRFPRHLLDDPANFDQLVTEMADKATRRKKKDALPPLVAFFKRYGITQDSDKATLTDTFRTMCDLHDMGRDHIWGYFTRNLARPVWFARPENRVDALIGNPPWLSYRFMPGDMQATFRRMTTERGMWAGASVATHQDLSALFVARSCELYLRSGGRFGFVMPLAVLSRKQYAGFRTGTFNPPIEQTLLAYSQPWDLHAVKPSIFPVPPSVVFGERADHAVALPGEAEPWSGKVPKHNASWAEAEFGLTIGGTKSALGLSLGADHGDNRSPYAERFTQGATVVPRMLFVVEDAPAGPLGAGPGRRAVRSWRSSKEKPPWKTLPALTGNIEEQFIYPMHLGETILGFRLQEPWRVVLPLLDDQLMEPEDERLDDFPGLAAWWREANRVWRTNRSSPRLELTGQLDYMRKFSAQVGEHPLRFAYTASGMYLAAVTVSDSSVVLDKSLYWADIDSGDEGRYLTAVFNADAFTLAVRDYQARGEHNPRHFDKYVFNLPIPRFDPADELHAALVNASAIAEEVVASLDLPQVSFEAQRRLVRERLAATQVNTKLDALVTELLAATGAM